MKVLYARTQYWFGLRAGGSVAHTAGFLNALAAVSDVHILSNERLVGADGIPCTIVSPVFRRLHWVGELCYNARFYRWMIRMLKSFCPDIVYHRYNGFSVAAARACAATGVPLFLEFNSSHLWTLEHWCDRSGVHGLTRAVMKAIVSRTEPYNLACASAIPVVSDALRSELEGRGIETARILVNPNGVDTSRFSPATAEETEALRRELGIGEDRTIVGFAGTFGEWHGVPELCESIKRLNALPDHKNRLSFVLMGDGKLLRETRDALAGEDNVFFTGTVLHALMPRYLSVCDILLSPHGKTADDREFFGSPTKLFEYMAVEKAIVASDLGQIGEVLDHGESALLVVPGDVDGIVQAVSKLAGDPALREQLGRSARRKVLGAYTWEHNAARVVGMADLLTTAGVGSTCR